MVVRKKAVSTKKNPFKDEEAREKAINAFINRGGKTSNEKKVSPKNDKEVAILIRLSRRLLDKIDKAFWQRNDCRSRTQWIVKTLAENVDSE